MEPCSGKALFFHAVHFDVRHCGCVTDAVVRAMLFHALHAFYTHTRKTHQSICDVQLRDATFGIYCDTNGVQQTDVILTFISISCNFLLLLLLLFAVLSSFDDVAFKMFSRRQSLQPPDRQHWIGCCRCYCCCIRSFILVSFMNKTIPFL